MAWGIRWKAGLLLILVAGLWLAAESSPAGLPVREVIYPAITERAAGDYGYKVLDLALSKSGRPYRLRLTTQTMNQERARQLLLSGGISIMDCGTSQEFEDKFRTVYFPIDRGLSGYRLLIVKRGGSAATPAFRNLADLRGKTAGQGVGWADNAILEHAGIRVKTAPFESLFSLVELGRVDFFPLGAEEVFGFLERYRNLVPSGVVEPRVALHYLFGRLFFVNKKDAELQNMVMAGLTKAFEDGSFQALLGSDPFFQNALVQAHLKERTIIELENPNLTAAFGRIPKQYFLSAAELP